MMTLEENVAQRTATEFHFQLEQTPVQALNKLRQRYHTALKQLDYKWHFGLSKGIMDSVSSGWLSGKETIKIAVLPNLHSLKPIQEISGSSGNKIWNLDIQQNCK